AMGSEDVAELNGEARAHEPSVAQPPSNRQGLVTLVRIRKESNQSDLRLGVSGYGLEDLAQARDPIRCGAHRGELLVDLDPDDLFAEEHAADDACDPGIHGATEDRTGH